MRPNESLQPTAVHEYEVRPRKDHRGVDVISDVLPYGAIRSDGDSLTIEGLNEKIRFTRRSNAP
jgi:hypothetical protein